MKFDVFEYTSQGGRDYNEDSYGHCIVDEKGVFLVADGLGGHEYGEVASACVRDTLLQNWSGDFGTDLAQWIKNGLENANQRILEIQEERKSVLKSTAVVLVVDNKNAVWANVGDSRLYYLSGNRLTAVTNDHSVAFKKYKAGEITREQLRTDEDQSSLLRSLGGKERNEPEIYQCDVPVCPGDGFMLCTDGIWEYLSDEEILIDMLKAKDARQWGENLLLRVIDRIDGTNDNLTIMTVMIEP